jgi:CO/xanthine dehydrogenase FAD-binding subunit
MGERPTEERVARAASALDGDISPNDDIHASADDRRQIARALTKRALAMSLVRAA